MKAKAKAMEIAMRFEDKGETDNAKQCAIICVEREKQMIIDFQKHDEIGHYWFFDDKLIELEEVEQEIEKL